MAFFGWLRWNSIEGSGQGGGSAAKLAEGLWAEVSWREQCGVWVGSGR